MTPQIDHAPSSAAAIRLGHGLSNIRPTLHNGPGWRLSIWTQGCRHRCTENCLNPHFLDPSGGHSTNVDDAANSLLKAVAVSSEPVEGVTVLGGEPFEQAAEVAALLHMLRSSGLSTMVYSGHTWEHLSRSTDVGIQKLLRVTDLLVDGPFLPDLYDERIAWRGSTNQRLLCLSERYSPEQLEAAYARQGKGFSLQIGPGHITAGGLQNRTAAATSEHLIAPDRHGSRSAELTSRGDTL